MSPSPRTSGAPARSSASCSADGNAALHDVADRAASQDIGRPATSECTSSAFHDPHAAGPVARESASVRAASSSSVPIEPTALATVGDRGVVVEVTPGGDVGQEQVVADEVDEHLDVVRRETHARPATVRMSSMPTSVWSPG